LLTFWFSIALTRYEDGLEGSIFLPLYIYIFLFSILDKLDLLLSRGSSYTFFIEFIADLYVLFSVLNL
jgi:hypothetical protein